MALLRATREDVLAFLSKVDVLPNGCHFWTGGRSRGRGNLKWYGSFWVPSLGTTVRAHRFASEVFNCHECPPGWHRDHTCHFSLCVCPDHIEVVTREVNQERKRPRREDFALLLSRFGLDSSQLTDKD